MAVSSYAFHKYISFISQNVRLLVSDLSDFVLHRGFFHNSLITNLMIIHSSLTPIIILLYDCYDVTFCIWIVFVLCLRGKKLTKQTNKTVTRLAKRSFKTQLKNTLIKLKFSEAFGEKESCKLSYYFRITTQISLKSRISP